MTFHPATGRAPQARRVTDLATEATMSHELFVDVTSARPRTDAATSGTIAVSIVAHALVVAAVIVLPLLAADALPMPAGAVPAYVPDAPPPPPAAALATPRTRATKPTPIDNALSLEAPDTIEPESSRPAPASYSMSDVGPTGPGVPDGLAHSVGIGEPQPPPPPALPAPQSPLRLSAYEMPRKIDDVAPRYPEIAQRAGVEGVVIVEAVIAVDGSVRDARVLKSVPLLDRAAIDAVKQWRYAPTRLNGVAVPVIVTVTVQFRLQR